LLRRQSRCSAFSLQLLYCSVPFFHPKISSFSPSLVPVILCSSFFQFLADNGGSLHFPVSNFWSMISFLPCFGSVGSQNFRVWIAFPASVQFLAGVQNFTVRSVSWLTRMQWALLCLSLARASEH
jgi:hypothetical protein